MTHRAMAAVLNDEELISVGAALSKLETTEGWQAWMSLLAKFELDVGYRGIRDRTQERSYYEGYMDALREIRDATTYLIAEGRAANETAIEADEGYLPPRIVGVSGGGVSGA